MVRDQGVGGSNPLSPTNYLNPVIELPRQLTQLSPTNICAIGMVVPTD